MKLLLWWVILSIGLVPSARGQHVLEYPLATPLTISAPTTVVFSAEDAFAILQQDAIHSFAGLPATAQHIVTPLPGNLGAATEWVKVNETTAIYKANSGLIAIVRGLPHTPTVMVTPYLYPASAFQRVNDNTLVSRDTSASQFHVLRLGAATAGLYTIASSDTLHSNSGFYWGRSGDDSYMGLSAGLDLISGTSDDLVVLLSGLSGPPSGFLPTSTPLPAGTGPRGFVMSEHGEGAYFEAVPSTLTVPLTIVAASGNSVGFYSIGVPVGGITVLPPAPTVALGALPAAGFLLTVRDDISMAWHHTVVDPGAHSLWGHQPIIRGTFIAEGSLRLPNYEFLTSGGQGSTPFTLTSFAEATPRTLNFWVPEWGFCLRPTREMVTYHWSSGWTTPGQNGVTVIAYPFSNPSTIALPLDHHPRPPILLGNGRVAWLASTNDPTDPIDRVCCLVLPNNAVIDDPASPGYVWNSWLNVWPALPSANDIIRIQGHPPYFDPGAAISLFISDRLLPVPIEASVLGLYGAPLRLDMQHLWPFEIPLLGSPVREFVIPAGVLPPSLLGQSLYFQALRYESFGPPSLSHTILLTIG